jgi:hypothetical protein
MEYLVVGGGRKEVAGLIGRGNVVE